MEAFWCITLSILVIRWYLKSSADSEPREPKYKKIKAEYPVAEPVVEDPEVEKARKAAEAQRERDIADLKKQGYTDELIAVIIPTINNGQ